MWVCIILYCKFVRFLPDLLEILCNDVRKILLASRYGAMLRMTYLLLCRETLRHSEVKNALVKSVFCAVLFKICAVVQLYILYNCKI